MDQNSAKEILTELYNEVVEKVDTGNKAVSKDDIIDFLQIASNAVSKIDL